MRSLKAAGALSTFSFPLWLYIYKKKKPSRTNGVNTTISAMWNQIICLKQCNKHSKAVGGDFTPNRKTVMFLIKCNIQERKTTMGNEAGAIPSWGPKQRECSREHEYCTNTIQTLDLLLSHLLFSVETLYWLLSHAVMSNERQLQFSCVFLSTRDCCDRSFPKSSPKKTTQEEALKLCGYARVKGQTVQKNTRRQKHPHRWETAPNICTKSIAGLLNVSRSVVCVFPGAQDGNLSCVIVAIYPNKKGAQPGGCEPLCQHGGK